MSPNDRLMFERARPEGEVASIRQILAELLAERGLNAPEVNENRGSAGVRRGSSPVSAAA
jgi:hypothetical protein